MKPRALILWCAVAVWAGLIGVLMLTPGRKGSPAGDTSLFFGGSEITDAVGHVILFGVLAALLYLAFRQQTRFAAHAARLAVGGVLILGTLLEIAQHYVPDRGVALLDFSANWIGPFLLAGWFRLCGEWRR